MSEHEHEHTNEHDNENEPVEPVDPELPEAVRDGIGALALTLSEGIAHYNGHVEDISRAEIVGTRWGEPAVHVVVAGTGSATHSDAQFFAESSIRMDVTAAERLGHTLIQQAAYVRAHNEHAPNEPEPEAEPDTNG